MPQQAWPHLRSRLVLALARLDADFRDEGRELVRQVGQAALESAEGGVLGGPGKGQRHLCCRAGRSKGQSQQRVGEACRQQQRLICVC